MSDNQDLSRPGVSALSPCATVRSKGGERTSDHDDRRSATGASTDSPDTAEKMALPSGVDVRNQVSRLGPASQARGSRAQLFSSSQPIQKHRIVLTFFVVLAALSLYVSSVPVAIPTWKLPAWVTQQRFTLLKSMTSQGVYLATSLQPDHELSNGTHSWRRTVLMISVDGLKPRYIREGRMPFLQSIGQGRHLPSMTDTTFRASRAKVGALLAEGMQPRFPTLTFPNHWTLLTGLHAESHGIIANDFLMPSQTNGGDGELANRTFYYSDPSRSWDSAWWKGDPVWALAERSGIPSAVMMWPGPPKTTAGDRPSTFQRYESTWTLEQKQSQLQEWLNRQMSSPHHEWRPQLICAYLPDVDKIAHTEGPDSAGVHQVLDQVDSFFSAVHELIAARNATHIVDLVVVSDHGMTKTSNERLVYLDDEAVLGRKLFDEVARMDGWPLAGFHFKGTAQEQRQLLKAAEERLRAAAKVQGKGEAFDVFTREELPDRWHIKNSSRLAPLWVVPRLGWCLTHQREMAEFGGVYEPIGNHGYDNTYDDMQAVFVASGPSFKTVPNMPSFPNTNVHDLIVRILGVPDAIRTPNNGTDGFWDTYMRY